MLYKIPHYLKKKIGTAAVEAGFLLTGYYDLAYGLSIIGIEVFKEKRRVRLTRTASKVKTLV